MLKGDRHILYDEIRFFCNDVTERGVILIHSGAPSGVNFDLTSRVAQLPGTGVSGVKPVGLLLNDMVDVNQSRYRLNCHKDERQIHGKCHLLKKGWVYTNKVSGTPAAGDTAYLAASGNVSPTQATGAPQVGRFTDKMDQDGYAGVEIDI